MAGHLLEKAHHRIGQIDLVPPGIERGITAATIRVVQPGDLARIENVLDAVQPTAKVGPPGATFPGMLGPATPVGSGRTDVVDDVAVLATCDFAATHDLDSLPNRPDGTSIVDMAGPGARYSPWGSTTNVVVSFTADPAVSLEEADRTIRRATLAVARDLAVASSVDPPHSVEQFPDTQRGGDDIPGVVAIIHVGSEGPLLDTFLYGESMQFREPVVLSAGELLDGALTSGHYDWAALRNPTYLYQNSRLLKRLIGENGTALRFVGVIVARAYLPTNEEKRANSAQIARLATSLGATGAIVSTFQSGNSHTDTMLTIEECERSGIRTTGIVAETDDGLTDFVASADCLVSSGNEDDWVGPWQPEQVIGGDDLGPGPVSVLAYLGAMSQLGDGRLRAMA